MCAGARATGSRARSGLRGDRDAVSPRGKTPRPDPLAGRDFRPSHVAPRPSSFRPEHDPVSGLFNGLQGGKVSLQLPSCPIWRTITDSVHNRRGRRFRSFVKRQVGSYATLSCGSSTGVAHGQPRARVPDLVGSSLPGPYHFRARIQSFQAFAAPFPGELRFAVRSSRAAIPTTETPRFKRSTIGSAVSSGTAVQEQI